MSSGKPKLAMYWCASCGGCEEAVVDLHEALLDVVEAVDIVFWPVAFDFKLADVERMADGEIAFCLINGAVRTDEQRHVAELLRRKSRIVVGFGACAQLGGIPALANLIPRANVFRSSYLESPTVDNPQHTLPAEHTTVCGHAVHLPRFWDHVAPLGDVIDVDCYVPGCPPPVALLANALEVLLSGAVPAHGAVLAPNEALCATCARNATKPDRVQVDGFRLPHELRVDPTRCFLEQGIICCGPGTRGGCGEPCIAGNMPCTGCLGPLQDGPAADGLLLTALASLLDARTEQDSERQAATLLDPVGTISRYAARGSLLRGERQRGEP